MSDFCFKLQTPCLIGSLSLSFVENPELLQSAISQTFSLLRVEIAADYKRCMNSLPIEYIDPQFMLRYLPPGTDDKLS